MRGLLITAAAVLAAGAAVAADAVTPAPIVAAERAFAADGWAHGIKQSFLRWAADDAVYLAPDPVNAHKDLNESPDLKPGGSDGLAWWPLWAGIARSGDLGFTTGPVEVKGKRTNHYFTIWKKQPDGSWKWIYDGGGGGVAAAEAAQGSPASFLAPATAHAASPEAAVAQVKALEAQVAAEAATDQKAALLAVLASDGRVHAPKVPPGKDPAGFALALATRPATIAFAPLRAESSQGADFVWTLGAAKWTEGAQAREGYYVRVWQDRAGGWKLVYDQITAKPVPAPPAAPAG